MKNLLSSSAFLVLNKELARKIGLKEAILLEQEDNEPDPHETGILI